MDNVTNYLQKMGDDLISQFKRQPNTGALMAAVAKQLQALFEVQEQLNELRWLAKAEGKQLDGIGEIVVLSRSDAAKLELGKTNAGKIDDATFRKYLFYKMFLNTSTGTRKEIMQALRFFWDETPLYYTEDENYPATVFVDTPELAPDVPIEGLLEAPIVKPAGVRFIVRINTRTQNGQYKIRLLGLSDVKITVTQIAEADLAAVARQLRNKTSPHWKVTRTQVTETDREAVARRLRSKNSPQYKVTRTNVGDQVPVETVKTLRTTHAPQWTLTRTELGEFVVAADGKQQYYGLGTVKITKTPLAAYGGE